MRVPFWVWFVVASVFGSAIVIVSIRGEPHYHPVPAPQPPPVNPPCPGEAERRAWIDTSLPEMSGYSPGTFGMDATGQCATTLHVREHDCSADHILEAYGAKPFMQRALRLGFEALECGGEEHDLGMIVRAAARR